MNHFDNNGQKEVTPKLSSRKDKNVDDNVDAKSSTDEGQEPASSGQNKYDIQLLEKMDIPKLGDGMVSINPKLYQSFLFFPRN